MPQPVSLGIRSLTLLSPPPPKVSDSLVLPLSPPTSPPPNASASCPPARHLPLLQLWPLLQSADVAQAPTQKPPTQFSADRQSPDVWQVAPVPAVDDVDAPELQPANARARMTQQYFSPMIPPRDAIRPRPGRPIEGPADGRHAVDHAGGILGGLAGRFNRNRREIRGIVPRMRGEPPPCAATDRAYPSQCTELWAAWPRSRAPRALRHMVWRHAPASYTLTTTAASAQCPVSGGLEVPKLRAPGWRCHSGVLDGLPVLAGAETCDAHRADF